MKEAALKEKGRKIKECLNEPYVNLWQLRELALSEHGLVNDELRQRAWPLLAGIDVTSIPKKYSKFTPNGTIIPSHEEMEQVHRDVIRIPTSTLINTLESDSTEKSFEEQRQKLKEIINITLQQGNGKLFYYQGFHDIATIFLHVLTSPTKDKQIPAVNDIRIASSVLHSISESHLNQYMEKDFNTLLNTMTFTIIPMIHMLDPILYNHLYKCNIFTNDIPFFTLSWIITWFGHDLNDDVDLAKRLYDAMISSHPIFIIYLVVSMLLHPYNRGLILKGGVSDEDGGDDCFALMHNSLCTLPQQCVGSDGHHANVPIQDLIDNSIQFMRIIPPRNIISIAKYYQNGKLFKDDSNALLLSSSMLQFPSIDSKVLSEIPSDWYRYERKLLHEKALHLFDGHDDDIKSISNNKINETTSSLRKRKTLTYSEDCKSNSSIEINSSNILDDNEHLSKSNGNATYQNAITTSAFNESKKKVINITLIIPDFIISIFQEYSPSYYYFYYCYYSWILVTKKRLLLHDRSTTMLLFTITTTTTVAIVSIITFYYSYLCDDDSTSITTIAPSAVTPTNILTTSMYNNKLFLNVLLFTTTTTTTTLFSRWLWSWWR